MIILPSNKWELVEISKIGEVKLGKTPARNEYSSQGKYKIIKFRDIKNGQIDYASNKNGFVIEDERVLSSLRSIKKNDILITSAAHSGENIGKKNAIVCEMPDFYKKIFYTGELLNIRIYSEIELVSKWVYYFFKSNFGIDEIQNAVEGVHLTSGRAKRMKILIAPLNETRRILSKLEKIIPKVDMVKERLERIPVMIKRFRQSVLTAAVNGKLTEKWREQHPDVESAVSLLERIQKEREKEYSKDYEKAKKEGKRKPNKINITLKMDTNVPNFNSFPNWTLINLESLCINIVDCPHSTPKWANEGKICLRTTNFLPNKIDWSEIRYVSKNIYNKRIERLKPKFGDVLYSREGGILGVACILDRDIDVCLGQRMMLLRLSPHISNLYICYFLNSPIILNYVNSLIGGSASPHINVADIKKYPIYLPPSEEQKEIVRQVDRLFALADKMEAHYKNAKEKIDKLPQSILTKAFRGELVQQDPNDEPAHLLLEKIKTQKALKEAENKTKHYKKKK